MAFFVYVFDYKRGRSGFAWPGGHERLHRTIQCKSKTQLVRVVDFEKALSTDRSFLLQRGQQPLGLVKWDAVKRLWYLVPHGQFAAFHDPPLTTAWNEWKKKR